MTDWRVEGPCDWCGAPGGRYRTEEPEKVDGQLKRAERWCYACPEHQHLVERGWQILDKRDRRERALRAGQKQKWSGRQAALFTD